MEGRYCVYGKIIIPICLQLTSTSEKNALEEAKNNINTKTIAVINGDIYTTDDKCYPLIANYCEVNWFDVNKK